MNESNLEPNGPPNTEGGKLGGNAQPGAPPGEQAGKKREGSSAPFQTPAEEWRERQQQRQRDEERLREIDEFLATDPERAMKIIRESKNRCFDLSERLSATMNRTDLTVPELLWFAKTMQRNYRSFQQTLLAEKKLIERRHRPKRG